jgi:membrane-associated phospholipid phosphatase
MPLRLSVAAATIASRLKIHRMRLLALFACVLAPLFIFGELAEEVREKDPMAFDEAIMLLMRDQATPVLDRVMLTASTLGSGEWVGAVDVIACAVLLGRRRWIDALFWSLATGGAALLNMLAKHIFARTRPDLWLSLAPETSFSFPSGHSMQSMALAAAMIVMLWPTAARWPALLLGAIFTLLVGLSRIYLGVHYPSDVLAGWSASLAWVVGLSFIFYRHAVRHRRRPAEEAAVTGRAPRSR